MGEYPNAGKVLRVSFDDTMREIEADFMCGVAAAARYSLHASCTQDNEMLTYLQTVLQGSSGGKRGKDWRSVMQKRITQSWKQRDETLAWLDDKVVQVAKVAEIVGDVSHLPIYAHAAAGDDAAEQALRNEVVKRAAAGEALVVKPRHGANSCHVALWPAPREETQEALLASVQNALTAWDKSWGPAKLPPAGGVPKGTTENFALNVVPKGALLQPLYAALADVAPAEWQDTAKLKRPLELKVLTLFGEVAGGCLNTHCEQLWVARNGAIHLWDQDAAGFLTRHDRGSEPFPTFVVDLLSKALAESWSMIRHRSEQIARSVGLDELRVDWLLGDERWGPRIGELTYMGTFCIDIMPVSVQAGRAFAMAHLEHANARSGS
eukprot:TRINITY_DN80640_c0_g1_i1.p1 TRINITY_DN80640_c0_g1~~TRINITY_DN80640_c0_g1_i1.p1  ORF type:complete len:379 (+),score=51.68 TRINITY_DN80640_c0_g1_i1:254-1390(+)